ncbi:DUF881 domain-containing protein [Schaalia sp. ZJ1691]|uniref:DUF881 domain-containing protein n=1 Tax=Schaalia sp. ZJ1691 TaxID=2709404 RepID=UPI0013EBB83A|nr:DUF881 domain-containing protein [Schaalia sp. ZJ1691]
MADHESTPSHNAERDTSTVSLPDSSANTVKVEATNAHPHRRSRKTAFFSQVKAALFAFPRGLHVLLLIICFVLGFALVTQVRAQRDDLVESLSEEDLVVLLNELNTQEDNLRSQRSELQSQLSELRDAESQLQAAEDAAKQAQQQAAINAGTVAVKGEGVIMSVVDPAAGLTATQFVMTLGELRNAGAEAIELNGVRLSARSSFVSHGSTISVDATVIRSPYVWKVIGSPHTIATALEIQAGSAAQMRAKGANVSITEAEEVVINSLATPLTPKYAHEAK